MQEKQKRIPLTSEEYKEYQRKLAIWDEQIARENQAFSIEDLDPRGADEERED